MIITSYLNAEGAAGEAQVAGTSTPTQVHSVEQLLRQMQLPQSAATLVSEAALEADRDIEQDVRDITADSSLPPQQRSAAVAAFCSQCIQNLLREGRVDEALQVYEVIAPLHCPQHIDCLSLLFAQSYEPSPQSTAALLQGLMERPKQQESVVSVVSIKREIWFLKPLGQGVLLVDRESCGYVVAEGEVRHKRERLHSDKVLSVASNGQQFATGSLDRSAKVWDSSINLLYTIDLHRARINAVTFCGEAIACFDQEAVVSLHSLPQLQRIAVLRTAGPFVDACYSKRARRIIGVAHTGPRSSSISAVSLRRKLVEPLINCEQRILAIQLSLDEKLVLANVKPCEIRAYCLSSRAAVLVVRGFVQERHLMRMSQGGRAGELLAVSSEEGSVRVYSLGEGSAEEVLRVQAQSQQSVNCVLWQKEELLFGCDSGNLERLLPLL